jgi:hypothetical protein
MTLSLTRNTLSMREDLMRARKRIRRHQRHNRISSLRDNAREIVFAFYRGSAWMLGDFAEAVAAADSELRTLASGPTRAQALRNWLARDTEEGGEL